MQTAAAQAYQDDTVLAPAFNEYRAAAVHQAKLEGKYPATEVVAAGNRFFGGVVQSAIDAEDWDGAERVFAQNHEQFNNDQRGAIEKALKVGRERAAVKAKAEYGDRFRNKVLTITSNEGSLAAAGGGGAVMKLIDEEHDAGRISDDLQLSLRLDVEQSQKEADRSEEERLVYAIKQQDAVSRAIIHSMRADLAQKSVERRPITLDDVEEMRSKLQDLREAGRVTGEMMADFCMVAEELQRTGESLRLQQRFPHAKDPLWKQGMQYIDDAVRIGELVIPEPKLATFSKDKGVWLTPDGQKTLKPKVAEAFNEAARKTSNEDRNSRALAYNVAVAALEKFVEKNPDATAKELDAFLAPMLSGVLDTDVANAAKRGSR